MARVSRVQKGDTGRTMMHAAVANEVIDSNNDHEDLIKALRNLKVSPTEAGQLQIADANAVLVLKEQWVKDLIQNFIDGEAFAEFLNTYLDQWITENLITYLGTIDLDVCVDGSVQSITVLTPPE